METFITPVNVTPGASEAWTDVNLSSYIPAGATGVILRVHNDTIDANRTVGWRKNGSTDARQAQIIQSGHFWVAIGVDANRIVELYSYYNGSQKFELVGYFTDDAVFNTNGVDKSLSGTGSWTDISIASNTGTDTAIGAIFDIKNSNYGVWGFRKNGSTDNRTALNYACAQSVIGVDETEKCEGNIADGNIDFYLVGYIISGATFNTNATDYSMSTTGAWTDLAALPSGSIGGIFEIIGNTFAYSYGLRKNGSSVEYYQNIREHCWAITECDASQLVEGKIENAANDFYLVGYFVSGTTNVDVTPSALNLTSAIQSVTIDVIRNVESTPAAQTITGALLAVAVGIGALFGATQVNATMATIAPTVSAVQATNIALAVQNSNFALPSSAITANRTVDTAPSAQNANFALVASTITTVQAITISPSALNGVFATQTATVSAIQAINTVPSVQNTTLALVSAAVSAVRAVDISASTQNATFATVSPAISAIQNINIAPNTQNGMIALLAVSITSVGTVDITAAAQNGTFALPSVTVSCVIAAQINPAVTNATFADVAPAVTYGNNIAVSCDNATFALPIASVSYGLNAFPLTQNAAFALSAPAITTVQAVNVASTVLSAVFAIQTPTISGAGAINVELAALNATLSTMAPTITTIRFVEVAAGAQNITFTIPVAAIGAGLSVNAVTQNASLSLLAVAITTGVNANPGTQNAIFETQAVEIIANRSVNLEPSVLNITFADVDPVITGGMIDVNAATANATFATHTVSILAVRNTTVSPVAATGVLAMPTASITAAIGAYVSAGLQDAVFALLSRTVDLNSVTLSMNVLNSDFYLLRVPTIYTDKYSAKGTIYTDKYSAKGTIYTDKYSKI